MSGRLLTRAGEIPLRRDDAEVYRRRDAALAAMRERRIPPSPAVRAQDYAPRGRTR